MASDYPSYMPEPVMYGPKSPIAGPSTELVHNAPDVSPARGDHVRTEPSPGSAQREAAVPGIPDSFRAYVVDRTDDVFERGLRDMSPRDLPEGEVEIRVDWSSVNFKDGLAATADGK